MQAVIAGHNRCRILLACTQRVSSVHLLPHSQRTGDIEGYGAPEGRFIAGRQQEGWRAALNGCIQHGPDRPLPAEAGISERLVGVGCRAGRGGDLGRGTGEGAGPARASASPGLGAEGL